VALAVGHELIEYGFGEKWLKTVVATWAGIWDLVLPATRRDMLLIHA